MENQIMVGSFEIPEALAKELSELLTKQTIREKLLLQVMDDSVKFNQVEALLIPITAKIEAIKNKITNEYVPEQYCSAKYMWNYDGWEIAGNKVNVFTMI